MGLSGDRGSVSADQRRGTGDGAPREVDLRNGTDGRRSGGREGGHRPDTPPSTEGRDAERPTDVPAAGWKAVGKRVIAELKNDHVSLLAAGVAFKGLLSLFPAIIAAISIWGLVSSPEEMQQQLSGFLGALPEDIAEIIENQMTNVAAGGTGALSFALITSILIALWSASGGVAGLIEGANAAYNEVDERGFPKKRGLALLFTLGAIVFLLLTVGIIAVLPPLLGAIGLEGPAEIAIRVLQWPVLALLVMVALGVVYRYGPDRDHPQVAWATPGAIVATVLWLLGSAVFTLYVENFGSFGETYGAFAGIIVLMLWLMLSAFVVLLGAEINAELERQTARDTTVGDPEPMGVRGAVSADTTPDDYHAERGG